MAIGTLMEIENCQKPPDGYTWSGRRLTRKQTTSRPDTLWPDGVEFKDTMQNACRKLEIPMPAAMPCKT